jgi:serine/threonine protein kinase
MSKKIAQGAYGCVYKPSLSCTDRSFGSSDKYVSKLVSTNTAREEEIMMNKIRRIDPNGIFHYPLVKRCNYDNRPYDCPSNEDDEDQDVELLIYEAGGKDMQEYIEREEIVDLKKFYLGLWKLFFGLFVMHNNNYYHHDIKPGNIMVNFTKSEYDIRYIDFGFFNSREELEDMLSTYQLDWFFQSYAFHPFEATFLTSKYINLQFPPKSTPERKAQIMTETLKDSSRNIRFKFMQYVDIYPKLASYFSRARSRYDDLLDKDCVMMIDQETGRLKPQVIYSRIDVFMLGLTLKGLITTIRDSSPFGSDLLFTDHLDRLADDMNDVNISNRIGPFKAFRRYIKIVKDIYKIDISDKMVSALKMIPEARHRKLLQKLQHDNA